MRAKYKIIIFAPSLMYPTFWKTPAPSGRKMRFRYAQRFTVGFSFFCSAAALSSSGGFSLSRTGRVGHSVHIARISGIPCRTTVFSACGKGTIVTSQFQRITYRNTGSGNTELPKNGRYPRNAWYDKHWNTKVTDSPFSRRRMPLRVVCYWFLRLAAYQ